MKKRFSRDRLKLAGELREESGPAPEPPESSLCLFEEEEDLSDGPGPEGGLITLTVAPDEGGRRLDAVLAARRPEFSRSQLARLVKEGLVSVEGQPVNKASQLLAAGQRLSFSPPAPPVTDLKPEPEVILDIVYEDEDVLAVNKPWALAVHPAPGYQGPTLAGGLLARDSRLSEVGERFRPGLVHRLDKDTSGVLVVAKTETALRQLAAAFGARETGKKYLAFVRGCPPEKSGLIDKPIGRHPTQRHKMAVRPDGRPARSLYRVLKRFPVVNVSLVLLTLITGRTHQARVHLQSLGTPVLADPVYSRGAADLLQAQPGLAPYLTRQLLHARRLSLAHPRSGETLHLRAPWPSDFLGLWAELMKLEK